MSEPKKGRAVSGRQRAYGGVGMSPSESLGKVWLVGAGPGDPELITVRGRELLSQADAVLYDALSHPALLEWCRPGADLRSVGKRGGSRSPSQDWITRQLIELARQGRAVVRLKGGDPSLFARGAEEARALRQAGIPFEIVPGLPSPMAAAAYAGIPLTHRTLSSSVTFITGSDRAGVDWSPDAWRRLATATETICVLMGMQRIEAITAAILEGGRDPQTPAAVVQWAARPRQRVVTGTLSTIAARSREAALSNPALILIGQVVKLRSELRWYDNQPLFSKRILVPRTPQQGGETAAAIRRRGGEPRCLSAIEVVDPPDLEPLRAAARQLSSYDVCLFTSANAVERLFAELDALGLDARAFASCRVGAVGPKTERALRGQGLRPDVVARSFVGEGLAKAILALPGVRRVLIPRALVARERLPEILREAGIEVVIAPAYQTVAVSGAAQQELAAAIQGGEIDIVLFTSSSTVDSVVAALGSEAAGHLSGLTLASIGPSTSETLRAHGLSVGVEAAQSTVAGLLDALERHFTP